MFLERMDQQGRERQTPGAKGGLVGSPISFGEERGSFLYLLFSSFWEVVSNKFFGTQARHLFVV